MQKVGSSRKRLYKLEVLALKLIPMIIATCCLLNTFLSYLNIETEILSYLSGIGLLPALFLYLSSLAFKFCIYHRMFIYYTIINNIVCYIDWDRDRTYDDDYMYDERRRGRYDYPRR